MARMRTRRGRQRFTSCDDENMRLYFIEKIGKVPKKEIKPFGKAFWEDFARSDKTDRTASNLCSHFRKRLSGKMDVEDDLTEVISSFKTVSHRKKYTDSEEKCMWQFVHEELRNDVPLRPWNPNFWEKFITQEDSNRTASNLCSHFRKQMIPNFENADLPEDQKKFVEVELDLKALYAVKVESKCKKMAKDKEEIAEIAAADENVKNDDLEEEENSMGNDVSQNTPAEADINEEVPEAIEESIKTTINDDVMLDPNGSPAKPVRGTNITALAPQPSVAPDSTVARENQQEEVQHVSTEPLFKDSFVQVNWITVTKEVKTDIKIERETETRNMIRQSNPPPRSPSPAHSPDCPPSRTDVKRKPLTPEELVEKGVRFFERLVLITRSPPNRQEDRQKYAKMHRLMTGVLFGSVPAETFDTCMQMLMKKRPDPVILSFLKQALPHLKDAIRKGNVFIDGVSPPEGYVHDAGPKRFGRRH